MNSILWTQESDNYKSSLFKNFRYAIGNYLNKNLSTVENITELNKCKNLFVIDEHFEQHKKLLTSSKFINSLNKLKIKVVIFNTEKIYDSFWNYNLKTQKKLSKIDNLIQILSDVDDISKIGSPFPNKQYLSENFP